MRKIKKALVTLLALAILSAGCSSKQTTQKDTTPEASQSPQATQTVSKKLVDKDVELTVMLAESNLVPVSQNMLHFQWMYEKTGIKIKFMPVPTADYKQKKSTLLSTNDLPDIIQVDQTDVNNFSDTGIFVDLSKYKNQLPNFFAKVEKYPDAKYTFIDGKPFGFPVLNRWDMTRGSSLVVRKDIMTEVGVTAPKTFDEFFEMLKKFKEKYPNSTPYVNRNGSRNLMLTLGYSLGSGHTIMYDPQAKKYLFQPAKSETKTVLAYLNKMYKEKLLDQDYISITGTQWEEKLAKGTGLSTLDNVGFPAKHLPTLQTSKKDADWEQLFLPKNSFGYARGLYTSPHQLGRIWAISTKSKNIDTAIKLFNWFYTEEACDLMNLGIEGTDFVRKGEDVSFIPDAVKKYRDDKGNFVQANMHKERGNAAYESFIPYSDLHSYFLATPDFQMKWYTEVQQKDKAFEYPLPTPPFTAKEREAVAGIQTQLETIAIEMFDKLIMGTEPIDSFDKFVDRMKSKGLSDLEKIYNDAYQRIK